MEPETIETPVDAENQPEVQPEAETIDQIFNQEKPKENMIPEAAFLSEKKGRKEAEKRIKELEKLIEQGVHSETPVDVEAIAEEFDVDPKFIAKVVSTIEKKVESKFEDRVEKRLKPFEEQEQQKRIDTAFNHHFNAAMDQMPHFKDIVNPEVIKAITLSPLSQKKTIPQIIEETYGHVVPGKRTIESTTPAGGKEPEPFSYDKAQKDPDYYKQVMADPNLKKQYNAEMLRRIQLR